MGHLLQLGAQLGALLVTMPQLVLKFADANREAVGIAHVPILPNLATGGKARNPASFRLRAATWHHATAAAVEISSGFRPVEGEIGGAESAGRRLGPSTQLNEVKGVTTGPVYQYGGPASPLILGMASRIASAGIG
jgi:hypothetical protein